MPELPIPQVHMFLSGDRSGQASSVALVAEPLWFGPIRGTTDSYMGFGCGLGVTTARSNCSFKNNGEYFFKKTDARLWQNDCKMSEKISFFHNDVLSEFCLESGKIMTICGGHYEANTASFHSKFVPIIFCLCFFPQINYRIYFHSLSLFHCLLDNKMTHLLVCYCALYLTITMSWTTITFNINTPHPTRCYMSWSD